MRVREQVAIPVTQNLAGIAASQALASAGPLVLTASPVSLSANGNGNPGGNVNSLPYNPSLPGSGLAWDGRISGDSRVILNTTSNESAVSFTIVGTDFLDQAQTEVLVGPASSVAPVTSLLAYKTIISITASAAVTNIEAGWGTEYITPWITAGNYRGHVQTLISVFLAPGATANFNIEATDCPLNRPDKCYTGKYSDNVIVLANAQTAAIVYTLVTAYTFLRIRVNSLTGGNLTVRVIPTRTV